MGALSLTGEDLTPELVVEIAEDPRRVVKLSPAARKACRAGRKVIEGMAAGGTAVYGVNTGFGDLARVRIPPGDLDALQVNLVRSHAAGVGEPYPEPVVRGAILLRANTLAKGASGVAPELVDALLALLGSGVVPVLPTHGSLGASGDLAPLAHMALALMGEGEATYRGERLPAAEALARAGLAPIRLGPKDGLALTNGTPVMTALGCLAVVRARRLVLTAALAGAMSLEAMQGSVVPLSDALARLRGHPGHVEASAILRALMDRSEINAAHAGCSKVQDPYSMRCFPQVLGAVIDALRWIHGVLAIECNAATDNPLVVDGRTLSGGNFHGAPVGYPLDLLAIAVTDLASIAERRTFRLLTSFLSELPPFLTRKSGLNSGLMIPQYTQASLVAECKLRSHPASVDSIPSCADQEDHVSMATHAARKALDVVAMAETVVGIELVCAAQGLEFQKPHRPGRGVEAGYRVLRRAVAPLGDDRFLAPDLEAARRLVADGTLARTVGEFMPRGAWSTLPRE